MNQVKVFVTVLLTLCSCTRQPCTATENNLELMVTPTTALKKEPSDQEVKETLKLIIELYKQNNISNPQPSEAQSQIPTILSAILQDQSPEYSSRFLFKMLRFLMLGSFFDKDLSRGLSGSITAFAADYLGIDLDLGYFPQKFTFKGEQESNQNYHDLILKYAKYTVGLGIACILTYLLVLGALKFLNDPQAFPRVALSAKIPFCSASITLGSENPQGYFMGDQQNNLDNSLPSIQEDEPHDGEDSPQHSAPHVTHHYGAMPQPPVNVIVGASHYNPAFAHHAFTPRRIVPVRAAAPK